MRLPRLYAIIDLQTLAARSVALGEFADELAEAGVELAQLRSKNGQPRDILRAAAVIKTSFSGSACRLILNDRADLTILAGWQGVHVGQQDLLVDDARRVVGVEKWVGVSTHTEEQVRMADASSANYVAVGPVFATGTKHNASPVVGLEFVRRARSLTDKPLVAIGGITRENARNVIDAGADSVAVITGLFAPGESGRKVARDFVEILR